jgi:hypothetical protein
MCVQEEERIKAERRDVVNQVGSSSRKSQGGNRGRKRNNNTYASYKSLSRIPVLLRTPIIALLSTPVVPEVLRLLVMRRVTRATSASIKDTTGMTALGG